MNKTFSCVPRLLLACMIVSLGVGLFGQSSALGETEKDYSKYPGYVDFDAMGVFGEVESTIEVFLKGSLLSLVREAVKDDDPELSEVLEEIRYVRVQVFPLDDLDSDVVKKKTSELAKKLEKKGWEIAVRVREDDEHVHVYLLPGKKNDIEGLVVMVVEDDDEATFVNIVGNVDPAQLGRISHSMGVDIDLGSHDYYDDDDDDKSKRRARR
jgi:hypothetical protein